MYKQTFFAAMSILLSLPMATQAGQYVSQTDQQSALADRIGRAVAQNSVRHYYTAWAQAVMNEEIQVRRCSVGEYTAYGMNSHIFEQQPVKEEKELYDMRVGMLQEQLRNHQLLRGYTFKATVPEMLTDLTLEEFTYLYNLLMCKVP